jgi:hypothetical protein
MLSLQCFDTLAVRAGIHAFIITYARTPKGRKKLLEAIALLQEHALASQITPISGQHKTTPRQRETLVEGQMYLEAIRDLLDGGRV